MSVGLREAQRVPAPAVATAVDGTSVGFATGLRLEGLELELKDLFVDPGALLSGVLSAGFTK